ncbi:MAG: hypothetical protein QOJ55_968, partial [Solirubrobacteraceae bacterium]|nr:hypothetical protein [Solirubrobacteraceae bacterium]
MLQEFLASYYGTNPSERLLLGRAAEPNEIAATAIHLDLDATAMTG